MSEILFCPSCKYWKVRKVGKTHYRCSNCGRKFEREMPRIMQCKHRNTMKSKILEKQHGKCAICGVEIIGMGELDHDHATGMTRGVLCHSCNCRLGHLELGYSSVDESWHKKALAYILKFLHHQGDSRG